MILTKGHLGKFKVILNSCQDHFVMENDKKLIFDQRLLMTCYFFLTLSFGHLCKFKVTIRKTMHPLLSDIEIIELLYFLSRGYIHMISELDHSTSSLYLLFYLLTVM